MSGFVHLRVHTQYSLVDSVVRIPGLIKQVRHLDMPAVAVTDQSNVFGMVKFYRAAVRAGVKPLIGADVWIAEDLEDREPSRLTLLCAGREGFRCLSRLLTRGYAEGQRHGRALIFKEWLAKESVRGLIALSGAKEGELGRALLGAKPARAPKVAQYWERLFPQRFYIELQRLGKPQESVYLERAVNLAAETGIPIVATNDVRFLQREDFEAHEARVCIQQGRTLTEAGRPREYSEHQFLKSPSEMAVLFEDLPEALANTMGIAERCSFDLELGGVYLPDFGLPDDTTAQAYLRKQAREGLEARIEDTDLAEGHGPDYVARLESELDVICEMGFDSYFLIVADFIGWARKNSIPVGPGRGSGAGSLVAYALGITDLDPIAHDLLFERFLNPERVSMPDFDVDFCIEGRDRVIDYVARRYGHERVSQIITHGTMAARAVVRDVGRVLGMPYGYVDRIAKLIPFELGITLEKALAEDEELRSLYENEDDVRELIDLARSLEGLARNAGTHAGGVVIAPAPLTAFMPLYCELDGGSLTQLDKDDVEAIGLVKFDFLGLKTLTIIDKAIEAINRQRNSRGEVPIRLADIPFDDPKTYELLRSCETTAVFQFESRGMRDLIKRLQPDNFDDLVAINALFRPGPMQMADDFISRKHGREPIDYLHPSLERILKPTYGVILYQEQVMQIAQVLAGYSLGGADLLRRAMGKKKPQEMAKQRSVFLAGAAQKGIEKSRASYIFDLMEKFAGYGFNKSHSAAYVVVAYQTAWLKAHYPEAFMAAVMTADMDNTDKLVLLRDDCAKMGITLDAPNVNSSRFEFSAGGDRCIGYGLGAIKGVGHSVVEAIVSERDARGAFTDLLDLCRRVDQQKLGRRVLEALVRSGALDGLGGSRATLMQAIPNALRLAERSAYALAAGQTMLFGESDTEVDLDHVLVPMPEWTERERLAGERESLGLYLSGHPFDQYREHCAHFTHGSIANVVGALPANGGSFQARRQVTLAGLVMDIRRRGARVTVLLDDNSERVEVTFFEETFRQYKHLINKDTVLVIRGQLRFDEFLDAWRVTAQSVRSVDEAIEAHARLLTVNWRSENPSQQFVHSLKEALAPFTPGGCEVCVRYTGPSASGLLTLGEDWTVRPTRELRDRLNLLLGEEAYAIHYPKFLP